MVRLFLAMLAYAAALLVVASLVFAVVIVLAGPHAGILSYALEVLVMVLGWLVVLVVPFLVARKVWLRLGAMPPKSLS